MELPADFTWREWLDGWALVFNGCNIAMTTPLSNGHHRIAVNCGCDRLRYVFLGSETAAIRYVEAWAVKWQQEIRVQYLRGPSLFPP
ncbi:hypothetical protein DYQ93_11490 [Xanthomonas sp. LMG 8992]|uniref:hypothetical protein n=1 Tax=Xanthomonas sp. LMG 8992 TaxID=1591157 RepID=UPI00136EED08|nr:hypothetical protein [Xanthomonas sp. LMG 8992]MXV11643.1 hypothetical protein [Xanthomonas sp. LMG 8992]